MNMKSLFALTLVTAAAAASATVTTGNTLCRIEVTSPSTETILAVPLIEIGGSSQEIAITNLVLASSLSVGDTLMYKDGSTWYSWEVNSEHNWEALSTSSGSQSHSATAGVDAQFTRGSGVWLVRSNTSSNIYLYGQCDSRTTSTSFSAGTTTSPVYTLMGNPKEEAFAPNSKTWSGCGQGDKIAFADATTGKAKTFTFRTSENAWCKPTVTKGAATWTILGEDDTIPAGQGFWYVSVGGSGSVTW